MVRLEVVGGGGGTAAFQFQNGTIRRLMQPLIGNVLIYFNSKVVRLEVLLAAMVIMAIQYLDIYQDKSI